jgi:hypothetical protein
MSAVLPPVSRTATSRPSFRRRSTCVFANEKKTGCSIYRHIRTRSQLFGGQQLAGPDHTSMRLQRLALELFTRKARCLPRRQSRWRGCCVPRARRQFAPPRRRLPSRMHRIVQASICRYRIAVFRGRCRWDSNAGGVVSWVRQGDQALIDEAIYSAAYSPTGSASYPTQSVGRPVLIAADLTRTADKLIEPAGIRGSFFERVRPKRSEA